ncbi:hypothetical protein HN604_00795, partial [archaeon]|nr:hypothetical protein [archaeon]
MKQKRILVIAFLFSVLAISLSSAAISINEPDPVYNLGDEIYIRIDGIIGTTIGNLNVNLACKNNTINLARFPATSFDLETESSLEIKKQLIRADLEVENLTSVVGNCQIGVSLGPEYISTGSFVVSKEVNVIATLNQTAFDPRDPITVSIQATKFNGDNLAGFIEGSGATFFSEEVSNGNLVHTFYMPETIESGPYSLTVYTYDFVDGEILNSGTTEVAFEINQIPSSILLSLSDSVAIPGESFDIGTEIVDQSGKIMEGLTSITIVSPSDTEEDILLSVPANSFKTIEFLPNSTAGAWMVIANFHDIEEVREFEVAANMKATYDFEDSVLIVKNVGNVVFNKTISVTIGEELFDIEIQLGLGETRKFALKGENPGEYNVLVDDGEQTVERQLSLV